MDGVVKLLAIAERGPDHTGRDSIGVRVHPAILPRSHPLAGVRDAYNAVFVEADAAGQLMFYGRGAGGAPTASAVLGDLVAVCRNRLTGARGAGDSSYAQLRIRPMGETVTRYHVSLDVADKAGVLASVAQAFAVHDVSIQTVRQEGHGDDATLVLVTPRGERRGAGRDRRGPARARRRAGGRQRDAGRRGSRMITRCRRDTTMARTSPWRGVIEEFRDRLPVSGATPVVTLREGGTPLVPAPRLSALTGCDVHLKVEGLNPTGSFKDRGMTHGDQQGGRGRARRPSSAPRPATPRRVRRPTRCGPA